MSKIDLSAEWIPFAFIFNLFIPFGITGNRSGGSLQYVILGNSQ